MRACSICLVFAWLVVSLACSGPASAPASAPDPALSPGHQEVAEAAPKIQKECFVEGSTRCNGSDLMQCAGGVWQRLNTCPCQQSIGDDGVTFAYCLD